MPSQVVMVVGNGTVRSPSLLLLLALVFIITSPEAASDFDYKKDVVSLNATASYGKIEKEKSGQSQTIGNSTGSLLKSKIPSNNYMMSLMF